MRKYNLDHFEGNTYTLSEGLEHRGVADFIESKLVGHVIKKYGGLKARSQRSIEDVGLEGYSYLVDIKTKDEDKQFHMPNLVSIDRLRKFYINDNNFIEYVLVDYIKKDTEVTINNIEYHKIEEIDWNCLQIANLGKGQIQIRDGKNPIEKYDGSREEWLKELKIRVLLFLDKQIKKRKVEKTLWENLNNE
jgi:hypothetical protein